MHMVEQQIRTWNVLDTTLLKVLADLPREIFVPPAHVGLAYADTEIPLAQHQIMLAPKVAARLAHDLGLQGRERVFEVGTGSGYLTALLAHRSQQVISLELIPELAQQAQRNLAQAGITHAEVRVGDGSVAGSVEGEFDAVVLTGSVAQAPQHLLQQLKVGGRLIAIVGQEPVMQATLFTRVSTQQWSSRALWDTCVPALAGFAQPSRFKF